MEEAAGNAGRRLHRCDGGVHRNRRLNRPGFLGGYQHGGRRGHRHQEHRKRQRRSPLREPLPPARRHPRSGADGPARGRSRNGGKTRLPGDRRRPGRGVGAGFSVGERRGCGPVRTGGGRHHDGSSGRKTGSAPPGPPASPSDHHPRPCGQGGPGASRHRGQAGRQRGCPRAFRDTSDLRSP